MGGSHRHLVDDEDEEEEVDDDVYMHPADYRAACRASKASE